MYEYFVVEPSQKELRHALFFRMQKERLLGTAMYSFMTPTTEDWDNITCVKNACLVYSLPKSSTEAKGDLQEKDEDRAQRAQGVALFQPWQGQV